MSEPKCETGCKHFTGGEIRHHKDCMFYPESLTRMLDQALARLEERDAEIALLKRARDKRIQEVAAQGKDWLELTLKLDKAKAALEFYAAPNPIGFKKQTREMFEYGDDNRPVLIGTRARQALKELGE